MKKYIINKKIDTMIGVFFILFIFFEIIRLNEIMPSTEWTLRLFRDIFLALGLASLVVFGIRKIRQTGLTLKKILVPLFGVIGMLLLSFAIYKVETMIKDMTHDLSYTSHVIEVKQDKVISPEMKEINIQLEKISRGKYLWLGLLFASVTIGFGLPVKREKLES